MSFPVPRKVHKTTVETLKPMDPNTPTLQRIKQSGVLRVGYHPDNLPFSYFSETGELIGFDIDMAQLLAREMKVKLEFFPFEIDTMAAQLEARQFDLIMAGIAVTTPRLEKITYSAPYMEATLAFIVPDHRRNEFASSKAIHQIPDLKIGIPHMADYFTNKVKNYLPQAEVIALKSAREFFEANEQQLDAILWGAENGAAWTLLYPKFQVVIPIPDVVKIPVAYPIGGGDKEFANFMTQWIALKRNGLEYKKLYDHWILGLDAVVKQPRWSIVRDVLHWIE